MLRSVMYRRPGLLKICLIFVIAVLGLVWYTSIITDKLDQPMKGATLKSRDYVEHNDIKTSRNEAQYNFPNFQPAALTIEHHPKLHPPLPSSKSKLDLPLKVIIVTQIRSGSSFAGELFNSNDDFMYLFEPLFDFRKYVNVQASKDSRKIFIDHVFRDLLQCHFKADNWKPANYDSLGHSQQCAMSKAIQSSPLCTYNVKEKQHVPVPGAVIQGKSVSSILEDICKSKKYITIKTIRVPDIDDLKELLSASSMNVKIIHLVRDPRGLHNSRQAVCQPNWLFCKMPNSCHDLGNNIQLGIDTPEWVKDNYILVRYEDLAIYPRQFSEQIYQFLNISMPDSVSKWLVENTKQSHSTDPYAHSRDGRKVATKWRDELSMNEVQYVQDHCGGVMEKLGYTKVNSDEDLRNANYSVLEPLNIRTPL